MKAIVFAVISLFVSISYAGVPNSQIFVKGESISGTVVDVTNLCPMNAVCVHDGSIATLSFEMLNGCQELTSMTYTNLGNGVIEVEAIRSLNPIFPQDPAFVPVCSMSLEYREAKLTLSGVYPPFQIVFKGTGVVVDVPQYTTVN